ncbi:hypothetical protein AB0I39_25495 [Kitasatospora purpeofusca]
MKTCYFCGKSTPDVEDVEDPFSLEINGEVWIISLCDDCHQIRCDDI